jgi:hypothetical protein
MIRELPAGVMELWSVGAVRVCGGGLTGGEPLYCVAGLSVSSRRLPRITQRVVVLSVMEILFRTPLRFWAKPKRSAARGSRLLPADSHAKLQSGSPPVLDRSTGLAYL